MLAAWALAACLGVLAWTQLGPRLTGSVEVPGSPSRAASEVLSREFGESGKSSFVVLFQAPSASWGSARFRGGIESSLKRAARVVHGRATPLHSLGPEVSYAGLATRISGQAARERVAAVTSAIGHPPRTRVKVTGFPVVSSEVSEIIGSDLHRAELVALPVTALILLVFFGSVTAAAIPLLFGLATISVAMGVIWLETLFVSIPIYATNVVTLVGIAIAIDYSMLYVARYREEARDGPTAVALPATAHTAGRALAISGAVVTAGLVPLTFVSIPFFSGLGLATVIIPMVSVLAAVTLLPALLRVLAPRLQKRPLRPRRRRPASGPSPGERMVGFVMRRALPIALGASALMLAIALPATKLELTGGSGEFTTRTELHDKRGDPLTPPLTPYELVIDSGRAGGAWSAPALAAERRLLRDLAGDEAAEAVQAPAAAGSRERATRLGLLD
ncbi:MAG TPA: MMPL family transporter, partial [Solirubrobacterales bacterium]|nr:MMPL family transporter [Solirubrobacterales bacterium]